VRVVGFTTDLSHDVGLRAAYDDHGLEIYRFALRRLDDRGLAEDVVQETFLRAWQAAEHYDRTVASVRVWLFAIARNVTIDHYRRRSAASFAHVTADAAGVGVGLPPVPDRTESVLVRAVVVQALSRLTPEHRQVLVESHLRGRSCAELAASSGLSAGTVRSRTFYALRAMRVVMEEMGVSS
jgi:RNA polymerase sigma-70 factor (ECF subfamily)